MLPGPPPLSKYLVFCSVVHPRQCFLGQKFYIDGMAVNSGTKKHGLKKKKRKQNWEQVGVYTRHWCSTTINHVG